MSKITFRADDDLVERLEACDASKSEVMREALRAHLDAGDGDATNGGDSADTNAAADAASDETVDAALVERVDAVIADRLDAALDERLGASGGTHSSRNVAYTPPNAGEINVNVTLDGVETSSEDAEVTRESAANADADGSKTRSDPAVKTAESACSGCGKDVPEEHVYCPNCGDKQSHRAFCECGDEVRTDWAFCPGCGRRTPAADVL